jgi:hypothetical protein
MTAINDQEHASIAAAAVDEANNPYIADANDATAKLAALSAAFPEEPEPRPLTSNEKRLATSTSIEGLEQAASFAKTTPNVGGSLSKVEDMRDAINYVFAYTRFRDEAISMVRRVDHAIIRKKLHAVKLARGLYRVAKSYSTTDPGDSVKAHVEQLQRALGRRRKKAAPKTETSPDPKTATKP